MKVVGRLADWVPAAGPTGTPVKALPLLERQPGGRGGSLSAAKPDGVAFTIGLASPPDRVKLVAEVMVDHVQLAEINQEHERLTLELYPPMGSGPWRLDYEEAMAALAAAKARLVGE